MPDAAALDLLRSSLKLHLLSVKRAIDAAEMGDVAAARVEMERGIPPLMAAGATIRKLENAEVRAVCEARSR